MKPATDDLSLKLRAISEPVRRRILRLLAPAASSDTGGAADSRRMRVGELERHVGLAQPTVSHHLRILAEAGLVRGERAGTSMWYSRDEAGLAALSGALKNLCDGQEKKQEKK